MWGHYAIMSKIMALNKFDVKRHETIMYWPNTKKSVSKLIFPALISIIQLSKPVLTKVGYCGPLNHTKSGTIILTKCILEQRQQGKKSKSTMKVLKQKCGKHCSKLSAISKICSCTHKFTVDNCTLVTPLVLDFC